MNDTLVDSTCRRCGALLERCHCDTAQLGDRLPTLHPDGGGERDVAMPATHVDDSSAVERDEDDPAARLGEHVGGRYRLDAILGHGGFGTVYRATHLAIDEPVAVKFLHPELARSPTLRARLRREAKALARLRHPHIVAVLDYDEQGDAPYIVMELVHGVTLESQLLVDGHPLPLPRVAAIFDALLQGLGAAHAAAIVHRDMKPDNVLLLADGGVKLLDFGIALMTDGDARLTATGVIQGTPRFMSPEQCRGREIGPRSDVYSVGVMLFCALTGEAPFTGESATDLMVKHMFVDPPPLAERGVRPRVPPAIEAVVRRALAKQPDQRPDIAGLRQELAAAFAGTDPVSSEQREQARRREGTQLSRGERGLTPANRALAGGDSMPSDECVALWDLTAERGEALSAALAVHGMHTARPREMPGAELEGRRVRAVVLDARDAVERTCRLRAAPATARVPILVVDLAEVGQTPGLIRAGASDVGLAQIGDEALCAKLRRMIRRGR